MTVNFKNLLPVAMRTTRWGQLAQAYQTIWDDLIDEKINPILNQLDIDNATTDEIKLLFQKFGFNLSSYQGFCSTDEYYKREAITLALRILYKTARNSFLYTLYIYNLLGDIFPLYTDETTGTLFPIDDWWENNEFTTVLDELDAGEENILYYSGGQPVYDDPRSTGFSTTTLDADDFPTLDMQSNVDAITRYLLLSFKYLFVEDATQFLSQYTIKALVNDISQVKKATETPFFEPNLFINFNDDKSVRTTVYNNYEQNLSGVSQESIYISGSLSTMYKIKFGTGRHNIIDNSITDVQIASFEVLASQLTNCTHASSEYTSGVSSYTSYRKQFTYPQKLTEFSELSLMHISGGCLGYSTFPVVKFPTNMNSNIQLSFQFF
jgi:hypothetical protein